MPKHHPSAAPLDTVLGPWLDRALEIGGGLQPALRALAASMPSGKRQEEWIEVCDIVAAKDERLAAAGLAGHPENWIPLIAAAPPGATSGDGRSEVEFLSRAIDITTRDEPGRGWWRPAVYPLLVMATAIAISCLLAVMVVPTFKQIFNDFGMRLPAITVGVIWLSDAIQSFGWIAVAAVAAVAVAWRPICSFCPSWLSLPGQRLAWSERFARFSADLLDAGLPEDDAFALAARASRPGQGVPVGSADRTASPRWLTTTVGYALDAPLGRKPRARLLRQLARGHDQRLSVSRSWLAWGLGPLAIFVTGFFIMLLVLALFMPLITLVTGLN
ncbi:MAG: hypothetical protein DWH79_03470 [Planctomycetota bacterium]|nr:MAG: hypothetical protein DWH79_03470 [Planctomycetota bacterium]